MKENRITVRLTDELLAKINNWVTKSKSKGLKMSDIVRQAIALLPDSLDEISQIQPLARIKPLRKAEINIQLKNEADALKSLQEW